MWYLIPPMTELCADLSYLRLCGTEQGRPPRRADAWEMSVGQKIGQLYFGPTKTNDPNEAWKEGLDLLDLIDE